MKDRRRDVYQAQLAAGVVAYALGLKLSEIEGAGRGTPAVSFARHVAMYLSHVALQMSLARVARAFERDRSTVAHACHLIEDRRDDPEFDGWIEQMEEGLRALLPLQPVSEAA